MVKPCLADPLKQGDCRDSKAENMTLNNAALKGTNMQPDICGWTALAGEAAQFPALGGQIDADYAVIGGGFTGLAAARRLAELAPDARIVLIDGKRIGQGASARNSGFAVANESPGHAQLHTEPGLASYMTMNRIDHAGMNELRRLTDTLNIDCDWEDTGSIHAAHDPANFDKLRHHAAAFTDLGVDVRVLENDALKSRLGTGFYRLGVESKGGALLQPAKLTKGLLEAFPENVNCYEMSPVLRIKRAADRWVVATGNGSIRARQVVVAVNAFFPRLGLKRLKLFPMALTASLTRPLNHAEEAEISHAASWGVLSPKSLGATMRLTKDRRILIRNTGEYRPAGISPALLSERRKVHADGLRKRFPFLDEAAIEYTWSGTICISRNAKPVFEQTAPGLFLCGGYNASGVSRGTIMGRLIAEMALGGQSDTLSDILSLTHPSLIPPRPLLDIGVKFRLHQERKSALSER